MSDKHRNLPPWMVKTDDKRSKVTPAVRKKTKGTKNRLRRVVEYWMNESELVETALCILKDKACDTAKVNPSDVETVIPETDSEVSDGDVTEQETVPYTDCMNEGTKPDTRVNPHINGSGSPQKTSQRHDDGLELVREIFFT